MNTKGIAGNTVTIEEFMEATAGIKAELAAFESLISKHKAINTDTLPSSYSVIANDNEAQQEVPKVGVIRLDDVVAEYRELINKNVMAQIATYNRISVEIFGQILTMNDYKDILNPDFSKAPTLNPEKRAELVADIKRYRSQSRTVGQEERIVFIDALRNEYNDFAIRFGSDYKYVYRSADKETEESGGLFGGLARAIFGSGESKTTTGKGDTVAVTGINVNTDMEARNASFKRLIDVFWMRSYLRLTQGIQICAIQPKMVEATNFGGFEAVESLKQLRSEPACSKAELEQALENSRRILTYSGIQADHVFGDQGFLEAGLLNKLGSATTFVLGNRPSAEALNMLIQLVYADIQEELIMATPGQGLQSLRSMYRNRYQASREQKEYYTSLRCSIDPSDSCGEQDAFSETASVGITEGDVMSSFVELREKTLLAKDYIDQAKRIQGTLDAARNTDSHKKAKSRADEL